MFQYSSCYCSMQVIPAFPLPIIPHIPLKINLFYHFSQPFSSIWLFLRKNTIIPYFIKDFTHFQKSSGWDKYSPLNSFFQYSTSVLISTADIPSQIPPAKNVLRKSIFPTHQHSRFHQPDQSFFHHTEILPVHLLHR